MKSYLSCDPDGDQVLTEDQIIAEFWDYWCTQMRRVGKEDMITRERCLEDWITINWAEEVKDDTI